MFKMCLKNNPVEKTRTTLGIVSLTSDLTCKTISDSHTGFEFCFIDISLEKMYHF